MISIAPNGYKAKGIWLLLLSLLSSGALAAEERPVALYQFDQLAEQDATYLEADIPAGIYRYAESAMLKDIVVTDHNGDVLPSQILPANQVRQRKQSTVALDFFPVVAGTTLNSEWLQSNTQLQIDNGAIAISVNPNSDTQTNTKPFYLIDLREKDSALEHLIFTWQTTPSSQFLDVEVRGSSDLSRWEEVASESLVNVQKDDQNLLQNSLKTTLAAQQYDFLRVDFPDNPDVVVTDIQATLSEPLVERPQISWHVEGTLAERQDSVASSKGQIAAWEYARADSASVEQIGLDLGQHTYGDRVRIYSRQTSQQEWHLRYNDIWFNAKVGGEWQDSKMVDIFGTTDRLWRVELNSMLRDEASPELVFYHPQQLVQFIANNNGPYHLAKTAVVPDFRASSAIFEQVIGQGSVAWSTIELQPVEQIKLPKKADRQRNWGDILFWVSLVVAVVVLALFAVRLLRQLQREND